MNDDQKKAWAVAYAKAIAAIAAGVVLVLAVSQFYIGVAVFIVLAFGFLIHMLAMIFKQSD
jgi:nitrate reductase NapE component